MSNGAVPNQSPAVGKVSKKDADYVFYELTRSICPKCRRVIDAKIVLRDNKVFMVKRCPDCGPFEALVYGDAEAYTSFGKFNKPGTIPLAYGTEIREGCPYDCGLCPDHQQHTCLGIIEVNSACNMDCPLCFSEAGPGFSLTLEEVEQMLDDFVRTEGRPEVIQFSGGEPTIHPQIIEFVRAAKQRDISFVMINTNGKRIARDDRFLEQLNEARPAIYFQFDGFDSETYRVLRGEPNILEEKLRALDRLAEIGLNVTLVPAVERGVNEHEVGKIIEFAVRHPAVRGINFQPAFHAGRHPDHDPMRRLTIPDILRLIETQTNGTFRTSDFVPVPCCFPTCNSVTYAFIEGDQVTPLPRIVNVHDYLDYISNRVLPDFSLEVKRALEGLWSSSSVAGSQKSLDQLELSCKACGISQSFTIGNLAQHMIMIMLQDFMDSWTFNQKNLMKCCKEFLLPGGKQIPFCAYNTIGYREQARKQLEAMEPDRRRARAEGRRFEPRSIEFTLKHTETPFEGLVGIDAQRWFMATKDETIRVRSEHEQVKQCCARLYESDLTRFLLGDSFHPGGLQMTGRLGRMLGLSPASRVLDAACGKGTTAVFLAKEFGWEVFGVDYGDQNVEAARSLAQTERVDAHVQFDRSDAEKLPFTDGAFDAVICECAFCTFPDKAAAAREFFRVLRRGGHVGISDLTRERVLPEELDGLLAWVACIGDAQSVEGYVAYLQEAGFSVDSIEHQNDALKDMVDQIRMKLLGAEIMAGLNKLQLPGIDLGAAKRMASSAMAAVKQGQLGYALICASKPAGL